MSAGEKQVTSRIHPEGEGITQGCGRQRQGSQGSPVIRQTCKPQPQRLNCPASSLPTLYHHPLSPLLALPPAPQTKLQLLIVSPRVPFAWKQHEKPSLLRALLTGPGAGNGASEGSVCISRCTPEALYWVLLWEWRAGISR